MTDPRDPCTACASDDPARLLDLATVDGRLSGSLALALASA